MGWLSASSWQSISGIIEIVAALATIISVPFFWRHKKNKNHAKVVLDRFLFIFGAHGIERTKIPRFLGSEFDLSTADISSDNKLLHALNENVLNNISERFGVRRGWLDGDKGAIYERLYHYKNLPEYVKFINTLKKTYPGDSCFLYAYKPANTSEDLFRDQPQIALVFLEPIAELDQQTIYRYYPLYGPFPWDHTLARYNLYAFFTLAYTTPGIILKGACIPKKRIDELSEGKIIPETIKPDGIWYPEDYAFSAIPHVMPMNGKEICAFWDYIIEKGWLEYFDKDIITRPQETGVDYLFYR